MQMKMEFAFVQNHKNKGRIIPPSLKKALLYA
jgi:hypothetical protein